jgi:hypothetical protein
MEIDMSLASVSSSARRALKSSKPKAHKGDVFVLERTSTSTDAKFKTSTYVSYCFAIVAKVDRSGVVKEWTKIDMQASCLIDAKHDRVMLINVPELQAAAREVYTHKLDNFFTDKARISALVLDRAQALR